MEKTGVFLVVFLFFATLASGQMKMPAKRTFNAGVFSGIGGVNDTPIPGIDLHYQSTILRLAVGHRAYAMGLTRELLSLSRTFYNWRWIAALYGSLGEKDDIYGSRPLQTLTSDYAKGMVMTGVKVYFAKRCYSQFQAGFSYIRYTTPNYPTDEEIIPAFEFSLGINLFRNYINEVDP